MRSWRLVAPRLRARLPVPALMAVNPVSFKDRYFSYDGRIGRRSFWLATLPLVVPQMLAWMLSDNPVVLLIWLVTIYMTGAINAKRLHDLGKSGWWQVISLLGAALSFGAVATLFVPEAAAAAWALLIGSAVASVWGLVIAAQMMFSDGEPGPNAFGDPEQVLSAAPAEPEPQPEPEPATPVPAPLVVEAKPSQNTGLATPLPNAPGPERRPIRPLKPASGQFGRRVSGAW